MITFDSDGSISIEFATGPVRVRPPVFGAMKRLRSERVKLARDAAEAAEKWKADHPAPEGDDDTTVLEIGRYNQDLALATEEANLDASAAWWRLVLIGDDTFKKLAESDVPADPDEWPAALLYDFRAVPRDGATFEELLAGQPLIERIFRHWGKGRSGFSGTPTEIPTPS